MRTFDSRPKTNGHHELSVKVPARFRRGHALKHQPEFWSLGSQENWISPEANKIMLGHISSALVDLSIKVFVVVAAAVVIPVMI